MKTIAGTIWILGFIAVASVAIPARAATVSLAHLMSTNGSLNVGDKKFSDFGFQGDTNKISPTNIFVEAPMSPGGFLELRFSGNFMANGTNLNFALFYSVQIINGLPLIDGIGQTFMFTATGNGGFILISETVWSQGFFMGSVAAQSSVSLDDLIDPAGELIQGDDLLINPPLSKVWVIKNVHLEPNDTNSSVGVLQLEQLFGQNAFSLTCPTNRSVECGTAWDFDSPVATNSSCLGPVTVTIVSTVTNALCGNTLTATRIWQATDSCSNTAACSQTVTILDTTSPVITCNSNRIVECGLEWTFDAPTATDICDDTNVTIVIVSTVTNALCGNTFAATRTWRATDSCTNSALCSQTVTIVDTTSPVITCNSNRIVECGLAWTFDAPTATDICDNTNVTIVIVSTVTNALCGNTFAATRTWRATDSCTNSALCSQTVTILDTTSPVITCNSNRIVECGVAWTFDAPTATDICDNTNVTIVIVSTVTNALCGNTFAATRTWRATDSCTNSALCSQTVTIVDTTSPVITCNSNRIVECGLAWTFDAPTATDICDDTNVTIVIVSTVTNALCGNTFAATRTWRATDSCTNSAMCSQTVTILDTTSPVITCNSNRIVECGVAWTFDAPTATDICDDTNVTIVIVSTVTNALCGNTFAATRTWRATDSCTNSAMCSQTVTILDTTSPVITCNSNRIVECGVAWTFDAPSATDICDNTNVTIVIVSTVTNALCGNTFAATRTWRATDSCTNSAMCSQTVTILDTTSPVITCNSNRIVECGLSWTFDAPSATDICDATNVTIAVVSTVTNALCGNTFAATRTWRATDSCTNSAMCSQTVTILDTTSPVITCNSNRIVECGLSWTFDAPSATDICDATNVTIAVVSTVTNALCGNTFVATRTWQATDGCSNSAACSQTVTILDTTPPVISCNSNRILECGVAWTFDMPGAMDICDNTNVAITVVSTVTNQLIGQNYSALRTWQATDSCSNSSMCSQTVTIVDTTPPQISCSTNITVECACPSGAPVFFGTTAFDVCDPNPALACVPPSGSVFAPGATVVRCGAIDNSGNTNTCSFTVTMHDTMDCTPLITCASNIVAAEFPHGHGTAIVTFAAPLTRTFCNSNLTVACVPPSGASFPLGESTVTCTVRDNLNNTNACAFGIRVIPYRLPVISAADSGPGTLRQALSDANAAPGENLVVFNLPGPAPHILHLLAALPVVTSPVILDGWSQPGFGGTPIIELDGAGAGGADGLVINAGQSTVRGLALAGFSTAIRLQTNGGNIIRGNFIGVDTTGTNAPGNSADGLSISSPANYIGGTGANEANIISGNAGSGVHFETAGAVSNVVVGNFIGTTRDGSTAFGNGQDGVRFNSGAARNNLGDTAPGAGNRIAFNDRNGVTLDAAAGTGNAIRANAIVANVGLGIDLGADGPTANDAGDADAGPNNRQNFPVLNDARSADGVTTIDGTLGGVEGTTYRLDFFLNDTVDPAGFGEGATYIGSTTVATANQGSGEFSASFPVLARFAQFVTATATDPGNNTSEFSPPVQVRTPPVIEVEPVSTNAAPGDPVTFCVQASGTPPIFYQWRLNGVNIPGATNSCYTISGAQLADGGTYSVVAVNALGAVRTGQAALRLPFASLRAGDNFADRVPLSSTGGVVSGLNRLATKESGEPNHAGKPGGKSVWYTWEAPSTGIATVGTRGSTFDTLLAVYEGGVVSNLVVVANDEDRGGYFTSGLRFNAIKNRQYHFAIDGYGGDEGDFIFGLSHVQESHLLPVIESQPISRAVAPGGNVSFTVVAVNFCAQGQHGCADPSHFPDDELPQLDYQWFYNGAPIPGATQPTLTISNVQPEVVGTYTAQVSTRYWTVESADASLQINEIGSLVEPVLAMDKFLDAANAPAPLRLGTPGGGSGGGFAPAAVVRGYTGTQVFNTAGATTSGGDEILCGVLGGASEWISFVAEENGVLTLNTDGSTYDTVMAVFRRSPTNAAILQLLGCDNNSGLDARDSALSVPVEGGRTNFIVVDGVNGAVGTLRLNFSLLTAGRVISMGYTRQQGYQLQFNGRPVARFAIQTSTNLRNWTTILTTTNASTGLFNFKDSGSTNLPVRFYRAQSLP